MHFLSVAETRSQHEAECCRQVARRLSFTPCAGLYGGVRRAPPAVAERYTLYILHGAAAGPRAVKEFYNREIRPPPPRLLLQLPSASRSDGARMRPRRSYSRESIRLCPVAARSGRGATRTSSAGEQRTGSGGEVDIVDGPTNVGGRAEGLEQVDDGASSPCSPPRSTQRTFF